MVPGQCKERFSAYTLTDVTGADKNTLPGMPQLVKAGIPMNIHRGTTEAIQQALMMGVEANLAAIGYADPYWFADATARDAALKHLNLLVNDLGGEVFTIMAVPSVRTRFKITSHVKFLLRLEQTLRTGIPIIERLTVKAGGHVSQSDIKLP